MTEKRCTITIALDEALNARLLRALEQAPGATATSLARVFLQDGLTEFERAVKLPMFKMARKGGKGGKIC